MSISKSDFLLYLAKQSAKGTAAAAPTIKMGVKGGAPRANKETSEDPVTGMSYATEASLDSVDAGLGFEARAYPAFLGMALAGVMGGIAVSGSTNYTHTFTASASTPWYTAWAQLGAQTVKLTDSRFDSVGISWNMNEPLLVNAVMGALTVAFNGAIPTGGTDLIGASRFTPGGGTFKLSGHDASPAVVPITAFNITPSRELTPEYVSGSISPGDLTVNPLKCAVSATVKPDNLALYLAAITGAVDGNSPATTLVTGSLEMSLLIDANTTLKIEAAKVPWSASWPDADPGGGSVELTLAADNLLGTTSVSPVKFTLIDQIATY